MEIWNTNVQQNLTVSSQHRLIQPKYARFFGRILRGVEFQVAFNIGSQ